MIYSSANISYLIIYVFFIPAYVSLAGIAFTYYANKSKRSSRDIEAFKRNLGFPGNLAFMGNPPVIYWLLGRSFANTNVERAEMLRKWMLISFGLCHLPFIMRLIAIETIGDKLMMVVLLILSGLTIFACARFGHKLLNGPNTPLT